MVLNNLLRWLLALALLIPCRSFSQTIKLIDDPNDLHYGLLVVSNWPLEHTEDLPVRSRDITFALLRVYTGNVLPHSQKPYVLGRQYWHSGSLYFEPRFPFELDQDYLARLFYRGDTLTYYFRPQSTMALPAPQVLAVYPQAGPLPANVLRMYVHFSIPMRRDNPYDHIHFITAQEDTLNQVLFKAEPALWDRSGQRLTVLFDPGRIKRGVATHEALGLALNANESYRLVIDEALTSHTGVAMETPYVYKFKTTTEDRESPDLVDWEISSPKVHSREPLMIRFDEPLDQGQLMRWIQVWDKDTPVKGEIKLIDRQLLGFYPAVAWSTQKYTLKVHNLLEDLAGNSLRKPFEVTGGQKLHHPDAGWISRSVEITH